MNRTKGFSIRVKSPFTSLSGSGSLPNVLENEEGGGMKAIRNLKLNRSGEIKKRFKPETLYISVILFNSNKKVLLTSTGLLPSFEMVSESLDEEFDSKNTDFQWMLKKSLEWENQIKQNGIISIDLENELKGLNEMRRAFLITINTMKEVLGPDFFGVLYDSPIITGKQDIIYLVILKDVTELPHYRPSSTNSSPFTSQQSLSLTPSSVLSTPDVIKNGTILWRPASDLNPKFYPPDCHLWLDFSRLFRERTTDMNPGLYVGLFYSSNTHGLELLVPNIRKYDLIF